MTRTSKKRSKTFYKKKFYLTIISELNSNPLQTLSDIAKKHNITKQNMNYYSRQLQKKGVLRKIGYGTWELTKKYRKKKEVKHFIDRDDDIELHDDKLFQISRKKGDLHKYTFQFPIIEGKLDFKEIGGTEPEKGLKNWKPQFLDIEKPFKIKYKNNNNKSITGYLKSRKVNDIHTLHKIADVVISYTYSFFLRKGLKINKEKAYCQDFHLEINDDIAKKELKKGDQITVDLKKLRGKITPNDPDISAKAWADTSPEPSIGTNDPDWWEAYLKMPLEVLELKDATKVLAKVTLEQSIQIKGLIELQKSKEVPKEPDLKDNKTIPEYIN